MASDVGKSPVAPDLAEQRRREGKCAVCGREAETGWTLCPSCGSAVDQDRAADEEKVEVSSAGWLDALGDYEPTTPGRLLALSFLRFVGFILLLGGAVGWLVGTLATCASGTDPRQWPAYSGFGVTLTWMFLVCAGCVAAGFLLVKLDSTARKRLALEANAWQIHEAARRKDTYKLMRLSHAYEGRSERLKEIGAALQEILPDLDAETDDAELGYVTNMLDCPELKAARIQARIALGSRLSGPDPQDRTRMTAPRDRQQAVFLQDDGALTESESESESEVGDETDDWSGDSHWGEALDWDPGDFGGGHGWDNDSDGDGDGDGDGD